MTTETEMQKRTGFPAIDSFVDRHVGPRPEQIPAMLEALGYTSLDELSATVVPQAIYRGESLKLEEARGEAELLGELRGIARANDCFRSFIGMGYYRSITPSVILRNVLENPGWYTQYTPYQAEISQGRLEALLHFQTMVSELCDLPLANASLLDEATAAAEAMGMCFSIARGKRRDFYVDRSVHPQTLAVLRTRAEPLGIRIEVGDAFTADLAAGEYCGLLLQSPDTNGVVREYRELAARVEEHGARLVVATDLLAMTLLESPGTQGADIAVGSSQRFGVPLGFGGPHAGFLAAKESYKRQIPGRIVGVSKDERGAPALRLAMQTREQHIRRERATSNICTAQVLLANMAAFYAIYHGPAGLKRIGERVHRMTLTLASGLESLGFDLGGAPVFDTLRVALDSGESEALRRATAARSINLRLATDGSSAGISLDEATTEEELHQLFASFAELRGEGVMLDLTEPARSSHEIPESLARTTSFLEQPVFSRYHAEHEMLRYLMRLQSRDLSLCQAMIPLGSCTMKLNGTTLMIPISWPEFADMHPFAPAEQAQGYLTLVSQLEDQLAEITGLPAVSLQPNAGAQGEYAGLLAIRAYHASRGESHRDVCLIPTSAHGTNPASAVMAGMRVVAVDCDESGNIDVRDLAAKAETHAAELAALMVTYPSTHGVFEVEIVNVCEIVHRHGGQVYLDGANMNAQVGLCRPGDYGADVCHLNLHKTFCIPHGGGGPGVGPIAAAEHLRPFLPGDPLKQEQERGEHEVGPVAAAPYGSAGILPISWSYIAMMGAAGLRRASQVAILNANYLVKRLEPHYPILYRGARELVAHEFILDTRAFKESAGVTFDDIAKRLMDFGIHAPTVSWPVAGTLMVEPTESESKEELDRFCEAMIAIREEIREIEEGRADRENNVLKRAPHTAQDLADDGWDRPYSRQKAVFPLEWVRERKFWPAVGRIDNAHGDRNLICTCDSVESYARGS